MKGWILVFSLTTVLGWCGIAFAWWYSLTHLRDIILESPSLGTMNSSAIDADAFTWSGIRELSRIVFSQRLASLIQILFAVACCGHLADTNSQSLQASAGHLQQHTNGIFHVTHWQNDHERRQFDDGLDGDWPVHKQADLAHLVGHHIQHTLAAYCMML